MKPESQRIAIARVLGLDKLGEFRYATRKGRLLPTGEAGARLFYVAANKGGWNEYEDVPDYPSDLNAMHEAEKILASEQCNQYNHELCEIKRPYNKTLPQAERWTWGSSAAQRAEAFLRTLNLWTEDT